MCGKNVYFTYRYTLSFFHQVPTFVFQNFISYFRVVCLSNFLFFLLGGGGDHAIVCSLCFSFSLNFVKFVLPSILLNLLTLLLSAGFAQLTSMSSRILGGMTCGCHFRTLKWGGCILQ